MTLYLVKHKNGECTLVALKYCDMMWAHRDYERNGKLTIGMRFTHSISIPALRNFGSGAIAGTIAGLLGLIKLKTQEATLV